MMRFLRAYGRQNGALIVITSLLAHACALAVILPGARVVPAVGYWPAPLVWILALSGTVGFPWGKFVLTLPLSRRTLGRTAWIATVIGPAFIVGLGKLSAWAVVASFDAERVSVGWLAMTTAFDVACAGSIVFLFATAPRTAKTPSDWAISSAWLVALVAVPVLATIETPPGGTRLSALAAAWLLAGLVMTTVGFLRSDRLAVAGGVLSQGARVRQRPATRTYDTPPTLPPIASSRLAPIARVLLWQFGCACLLGLGVTAMVAGMNFLAGGGVSGFLDDARGLLAGPLEAGFAQLALITVLVPIPMYTTVSPLSQPRWLRVLPLAGWEVSALVLARGLMGLAGLGTTLLVLAAGVGAYPSVLAPGPMVMVAGLACVMVAVTFGVKSTSTWRPLFSMLLGGFAFSSSKLVRLLPADPQLRTITMVSIGVVCLVTSVWWVHRRVTTSQTIYRSVMSPFGIAR